ncbi:hypothetical protein JCM17960_34280 [Magnetospira thiophila]
MSQDPEGALRRSPHFGMIEGLAEACPKADSLEMFRRMCLIRSNEYEARAAQQNGHVDCLIYLSAGQETPAAAVSMSMAGSWVLAQHRCHGVYLSFGGDHPRLIDELLGLDSGANRGMGGSPPLQDFAQGIIGHNGLVGDQVPVAAGVALQSKGRPVVCFLGDGAAEEDYVLGSFSFVGSRKLPLLFIVEDNDLSVLTPTRDRRTWNVTEVAESFGIHAVDITDDPWLIDHWVREFKDAGLPALINIRVCRELWHVGTGCDGAMEWDRFQRVRDKLDDLGLGDDARRIETETRESVRELWQQRLRTQSGN